MGLDEADQSGSAAQAGRFDNQLEIGGPLLEQVEARLRVVKRNGQVEAFDTRKIEGAIARAARDGMLSDFDVARGLARGVTLYLGRNGASGSLNSDDVHAAVERVLIEMGYASVASGFARHRARKRKLADLARGEISFRDFGAASSGTDSAGISVLNSDDTTSEWNRDRIVKALHQETELDRDTATRVAEVVEVELAKLNVKVVTSGLIRELVGAVLLSLGETDQGARHRRVGIPMYDAERTILGAEAVESGSRVTPDSTNEALAGRLKREFALARVYSQDVAEAHRWGDIHLHSLDAIDRVLSMVVTPDWVKLHGAPGGPANVKPIRARRADTLVAQMAGASAALRHYATESVRWDALNWGLAPYVHGFDASEMKDLARVLLYEFAYRRMTEPEMMPLSIDLMWSMPPHLHGVTPVGPRNEEAEADYDSYTTDARRLAMAILDVHQEIAGERQGLPVPELHVTLGPDCFLDRGFTGFLMHVSELVAAAPLTVSFQRDALLIGSDAYVVAPRKVVAHRVTLNVPRASYRSLNVDDFLGECERLFEMGVAAHVQKRAFLMRLVRAGDDGPLGAIARRIGGAPWFAPERAVYEVGVAGLDEATGRFGDGDRVETALLERLSTARLRCGAAEEIELRIVPTRSKTARERLAEADLRYYYGPAAEALRDAAERGRVRYTDPGTDGDWEARVGRYAGSGARGAWLDGTVAVPAIVREASADTVAHTIRELFMHSGVRGARF